MLRKKYNFNNQFSKYLNGMFYEVFSGSRLHLIAPAVEASGLCSKLPHYAASTKASRY